MFSQGLVLNHGGYTSNTARRVSAAVRQGFWLKRRKGGRERGKAAGRKGETAWKENAVRSGKKQTSWRHFLCSGDDTGGKGRFAHHECLLN